MSCEKVYIEDEDENNSNDPSLSSATVARSAHTKQMKRFSFGFNCQSLCPDELNVVGALTYDYLELSLCASVIMKLNNVRLI
jgi:hypothetical protein